LEEIAYETLATGESEGWYYQARIKVVQDLIERYVLPSCPQPNILDIGCGTGGSTANLQQYGKVSGLEPSPSALQHFRKNFPGINVAEGVVDQTAELFAGQTFDLAVILGVLYHKGVKDPGAALKEIAKVQKPGSWIIWNEAAYPYLYRHHDITVHGARRFYPRDMKRLLEEAGYRVFKGSHLLAWAYPIAYILARLESLKKPSAERQEKEAVDHQPLPAPINAILRQLTYLENVFSRRIIPIPFGVSYLVIAQLR